MRGGLVAIAFVLATVPVSQAAAADCVAGMTRLLDELSVRHRDDGFRAAAAEARATVAGACARARSVADAAARILPRLGDPAVRVMDAAHFGRTLDEWMGKAVVGVGLTEVLSIDIDEQTGRLTVIAPVPGSPAAEAGLRAGDVVTSIDGEATGPFGLTGSMQRLRIAAGESVDLRVLRDDSFRDLALRAAELPPLEPVSAGRRRGGDSEFLHLRLHQFVPGTATRLRAAMDAAGDVDGILLDLRANPGGLVNELREVAGLFLGPGTPIARIDGPEPAILTVPETAEPVDSPLAVIVGPGSASAAEALAGALQAHGRARLFGRRTFGKGLVHQTLPLEDGAVAMFPSGQLETPGGRPILGNGVDPDLHTSNPLTDAGSDLRK